ncbi:hypothetical protein ACFSTI_03030 [Rhizorhabdus histidinilytica]|uniref:Uncharacterized protein n=1 Tax=Rhizorhabdus histidinilytica TaxID=439228 RepID=A0A1T5B332_9SPHN|nr:hypothetical protein [Rhizorhabdus histidinilytica]SKB41467.1 hypothetical protein SAMN06295920_102436 [Rhizorhabdus histidinilytica]
MDEKKQRKPLPDADKLDRIEAGLEKDDRSPLDPPGVSGGTAGTGGDNKTQDELSR